MIRVPKDRPSTHPHFVSPLIRLFGGGPGWWGWVCYRWERKGRRKPVRGGRGLGRDSVRKYRHTPFPLRMDSEVPIEDRPRRVSTRGPTSPPTRGRRRGPGGWSGGRGVRDLRDFDGGAPRCGPRDREGSRGTTKTIEVTESLDPSVWSHQPFLVRFLLPRSLPLRTSRLTSRDRGRWNTGRGWVPLSRWGHGPCKERRVWKKGFTE